MMLRHWVCLSLAALVGLWCFSPAMAQTPGVLYTWDQSFGEAVGPNIEGWAQDFGANAVTMDNAVDGALTITETDQTDWAIRDSWNRIRESSNPQDYNGLDLTGLDSIEIEIGHNGTGTYGGNIYVQAPNGTGCCNWHSETISVGPGAPQTFSFPLSLLTADEASWLNVIGVQIWDHSWDTENGALTWTINEVRSAGTPLAERYLSPHAPGDLDGAVVKFDESAISGGAFDTQNGLSTSTSDTDGGSLRWVDLDGGPGAAIAWGNGRDDVLAVDYRTRPEDLSSYDYVDVRIKAQPGAGADSSVDVQFYVQTTDTYAYQSAGDLTLPVDNEWHVLTFPVAGLADMDLVQWHGVNLGSHAGNMQMFVDYVRFYVPEPTSALMLALGCVGLLGLGRKRN